MMVENLLNLACCLMVNFVNILYMLEINGNSPNILVAIYVQVFIV